MKFEINFIDGSKLWCCKNNCWGYIGDNNSIAHKEFWTNIEQRGYLEDKYLLTEQLTEAF